MQTIIHFFLIFSPSSTAINFKELAFNVTFMKNNTHWRCHESQDFTEKGDYTTTIFCPTNLTRIEYNNYNLHATITEYFDYYQYFDNKDYSSLYNK